MTMTIPTYAGACRDMTEVRQRVDALDARLVPLLLQRLRCMQEAARIKPARALVRDEARIEQVVQNVRALAQTQGAAAHEVDALEGIYRSLIEHCIAYELERFDERASAPQESP
jgi:isochorismate pyruvate lyase